MQRISLNSGSSAVLLGEKAEAIESKNKALADLAAARERIADLLAERNFAREAMETAEREPRSSTGCKLFA